MNISFPYGVWSGDVTSSSIVVSTKVECCEVSYQGLPYVLSDKKHKSIPINVEISTGPYFDRKFGLDVRSYRIKAKRCSSNYRVQPGDYVLKAEIFDLSPSQIYFYRFIYVDCNKKIISSMGSFTTLPDPSSDVSISFAVISCKNIPPFTPINGLVNDASIKFVHFNGDTIYSDLYTDPKKINPKDLLCFYRNLYMQLHDRDYVGDSLIRLYQNTPFYNNWDDHEIIDNYSGNSCGYAIQTSTSQGLHQVERLKQPGYRAFIEYSTITSRLENYSVTCIQSKNQAKLKIDPIAAENLVNNQVFRKFKINKMIENFILDERQYRDTSYYIPNDVNFPFIPVLPPSNPNDPNGPSLTIDQLLSIPVLGPLLNNIKENNPELFAGVFGPPGFKSPLRNLDLTILGSTQFEWLKMSLLTSNAKFKFIINEVPISNFFVLPYDYWLGYYKQRQELLDFIEDNNIQNVIFLTGDVHFSSIIRVNNGQNKRVTIWEITTGPIGQETYAVDIESISSSLNPEIVYGFINAFHADIDHGGIPGLTDDTLKYFDINNPNYMKVNYDSNNNSVTISIRDKNGNIIVDPLGRIGSITLS